MPKTVQLRRYDLKPELVEAFLPWWRDRLVPAREACGFGVEFGFLDRDQNVFTWAVSIDGDAAEFARVEAAYVTSAERAAAFEGVSSWHNGADIALVETIEWR